MTGPAAHCRSSWPQSTSLSRPIAGDFHIDPWRPVARALITHADGDHARFGSDLYVCHRDTAPMLRKRPGRRGGPAAARIDCDGPDVRSRLNFRTASERAPA